MRTQGAFYADTPHGGGFIFHNPSQMAMNGTFTFNRVSTGQPSVRFVTGAATLFAWTGLDSLKRLQLAEDTINGSNSPASLPFQTQFGTAAGGTGYPAGPQGVPPFTGATQLTPPTLQPAKGIRVYSVSVIYQLATNALSAHTIAVYRNTFTNGAVLAQTTVLAATSLGTAVTTNISVVTTAISTPGFEVAAASDLIAEVTVTSTASAPTYDLFGIVFNCDFNYD